MNILFTCAGRRTYLLKYFKENLEPGDQILATDMQLSAPALQAADIKLNLMLLKELNLQEEQYFMRLKKREQVKFLI